MAYLLGLLAVVAVFWMILIVNMKSSWGGHKPTGGDLLFTFLCVAQVGFVLYYKVVNLKVFLFRKRAGAQREMLEAEGDKHFRSDQQVSVPVEKEDWQRRGKALLIGVGCGFFWFLFAWFVIADHAKGAGLGWFFVLGVVFLGFGATISDMAVKNVKWIQAIFQHRAKSQTLSGEVTLDPPPKADGVLLLVGEQHSQTGKRLSNPSWFSVSGGGLFTGFLIVGDTGSGKSTCVGFPWLYEFLDKGLGGLVLSVDGSYVPFCRKAMADCGREDDLIVIEPGGEWAVNLLNDPAISSTDLAGWLFMVMSNLDDGKRGGEAFWEKAGIAYTRTLLEILRLHAGYVTLDALYKLNNDAELRDELLSELYGDDDADEAERTRIEHLRTFFEKEWAQYPPNLKGSIPAMLNTLAAPFDGEAVLQKTFCPPPDFEGPLFEGFNSGLLNQGKVVVLSMPLRRYPTTGRVIATLLKLQFQQAVLRRAEPGQPPVERPCFQMIDEAQNYVSATRNDGDAAYLGESRKGQPINVYMSQSIDSFYDAFGDNERAAKVFFNNLRTKIFLSQEGEESQEICAKLCGKSEQWKKTVQEGEQGREGGVSYVAGGLVHETQAVSKGVSYQENIDFIFHPHHFRELPQFISIVSPFDGARKLKPRVVYMKPMFVNKDSGTVEARLQGSWFEGERTHMQHYREFIDAGESV